MKERNLWKINYEMECLVANQNVEIYVSTKTDHEPEALDVAREIVNKMMGSHWSFVKFTNVELLGQTFSIKKK